MGSRAWIGVGLAIVAYVGMFVVLHPWIGDSIVVIGVLPIIAVGWHTNVRGGLLAAAVFAGLTILLMQTVGSRHGFRATETPRVFAGLAIGAAAGWARTLTRRLRAALDEKEALLKEIHHRVKNNLQVISSLINLQARRVDSPQLAEVFEESQRRIQAIALVHERLYQSRDLAAIDFDDYLRSLVSSVIETQDSADRRVVVTTEISGMRLPIEVAIPCGLIVNELVTNALRHAFPHGRSGTISVAMKTVDDTIELSVSDDGIGMPASVDPTRANTLGLELVHTFAHQLDATVDVRSDGGTAFTVRFSSG